MKALVKLILLAYISLLIGYCTKDMITLHKIYALNYLLITLCIFGIGAILYALALFTRFKFISTTPNLNTKSRDYSLDVARTTAVLFVPIIHFFGISGYYNTPINDSMLIPTMIRWLVLCSVPIFMIISGYFKGNKGISLQHYKSIIPVLLTHLFISTIRVFVDYYLHDVNVNWDYIINKLLYFEYGWYVKLYIGMLLLMPFFNSAYKYLDAKWKKEIFILTLVGLTSLGPLTYNIIPSSWTILYVFGYYLIGVYLAEYKVKIHPLISLCLILALLYLATKATILHNMGTNFDWDFIGYKSDSGYSSLIAVILSVLIILFFTNIKSKHIPFKHIFRYISSISLEMYLFSQLFDGFVYKSLLATNQSFTAMCKMALPLILTVYVLSIASSLIKQIIFYIPKLLFDIAFIKHKH